MNPIIARTDCAPASIAIAFGVRRVHVQLTKACGLCVNRKKVRRIMRLKRWTMHQRSAGCRPRAGKRKSIAEKSNQRWVTDLAYVPCSADGHAVFVPVIDCCTREVLGWELARTGSPQLLHTLSTPPKPTQTSRMINHETCPIRRGALQFIAGAGLDPAVVQALKNALLLQRSHSVLTNVEPSLTRFIKVKDSDYDGLRKEMEKATRFGEVEN